MFTMLWVASGTRGIEKNEEAIADVTIQYTGVQYLLDGMEIVACV